MAHMGLHGLYSPIFHVVVSISWQGPWPRVSVPGFHREAQHVVVTVRWGNMCLRVPVMSVPSESPLVVLGLGARREFIVEGSVGCSGHSSITGV